MKFIDEAIITVQSGDGGKGCVSFRRERFIPRGGPDGGDGGNGGDVSLISTFRKRTLFDFRFKNHFKASNGQNGHGKKKTGKNGKDLIIEIPAGTAVSDADTGETLVDFDKPDKIFAVAKGGRGGRGNARFKTSKNRSPRFAQPGQSGQACRLKLELKLIADVGIIGLPNAGKSTLIRAISSARPKTGSYPFTTLTPNLGVVQADWDNPFVVADIPGLIEGAHQGAGLGIRFLRHIERTRILVHLIDASEIDPENPLTAYETVNRELSMYGESLADKPRIVVLNKLDLPDSDQKSSLFLGAAKGVKSIGISAITGEGVENLISNLVELLEKSDG